MERKNITLSLPKDLIQKVRILAAKRGASVSSLLSEFLEQIVTQEKTYRSAAVRMKKRMKKGYDLGTRGLISWTKDDLHER